MKHMKGGYRLHVEGVRHKLNALRMRHGESKQRFEQLRSQVRKNIVFWGGFFIIK